MKTKFYPSSNCRHPPRDDFERIGMNSSDPQLFVYMSLFLQNPERYRSIIISDNQLALYKKVMKASDSGISSREVADFLGVSIHSASGRLKELYRRGWLGRREVCAESGGIEFLYFAKVKL